MIKPVVFTIIQCFLLASGQVCFKFAVEKITKLQFSREFFVNSILTNWWLLATGICMTLAGILWGYILKHFEFSVAYPITAFAYIFGVLAAIFIFHETVSATRWIGVALIILGAFFVAK
ncbi:MAG: EamA family transporter [Bacteroidales bacterium]|jgi:drug/metabolite transporter (DMT)-like permease|nr:EamA family transporter [Bacteroidales bacterium]